MDIGTYLRFALALAFVLGLIVALSWAWRRFAMGPGGLPGAGGKTRLQIVESRGIDAKRRLILVRRDGVEHLILLGPASETVVETGITPPAASPKATAQDSAQDSAQDRAQDRAHTTGTEDGR